MNLALTKTLIQTWSVCAPYVNRARTKPLKRDSFSGMHILPCKKNEGIRCGNFQSSR